MATGSSASPPRARPRSRRTSRSPGSRTAPRDRHRLPAARRKALHRRESGHDWQPVHRRPRERRGDVRRDARQCRDDHAGRAPGHAVRLRLQPRGDALRIVSDTGQNLRALPSTRAAGPVGTTFTDGTLNYGGTTATVHRRGAAYTNNDNDAGDRDDALRHRLEPRRPRAPEPAEQRDADEGRASWASTRRASVGFDIRTTGGMNIAYASAHGAAGPWRDARDALPGRPRDRRGRPRSARSAAPRR